MPLRQRFDHGCLSLSIDQASALRDCISNKALRMVEGSVKSQARNAERFGKRRLRYWQVGQPQF